MSDYNIYVACLASYNEGFLHGKWISVEGKDGDDLREEIAAMLKESKADHPEEWEIHDEEGFDGKASNMSLDEIAEYVDMITSSEHEKDLIENVMALQGFSISEAIDFINDNYEGVFDTIEDWAEHILDEGGALDGLHKSLRYYFNYSAYARDEEMNGSIISVRGDKGLHVLRNS